MCDDECCLSLSMWPGWLQKWEDDSGPGDQTVLKRTWESNWLLESYVVLLDLGIERGSFLHFFLQLNCDTIYMVKPSLSVQSIEEVQINIWGLLHYSATEASGCSSTGHGHCIVTGWSFCLPLHLVYYPTKWSPANCPHSDIYSTRDFLRLLRSRDKSSCSV